MKKIKNIFFITILCLSSLVALFSFIKAPRKVNASPTQTEMDTTIDTVSLSDLTWGGESGHVKFDSRSDVNATYTKTSTNGSLILKFKYDVVKADGGDSISFCVYTGVESEIWNDTNGHSLLLRQDGIYMQRYKTDNGFSYKKISDGLSVGMHEIEFGRVYLTSGDNQGKYYVYAKIDGEVKQETYNPYNTATVDNRIFFHFNYANTMNNPYDMNFSPSEFETPDEITVRDLKHNDSSASNIMIFDKQKSYSYASTAEHKSVIFKFKYTVSEMPTGDYGYTQIHFCNTWGNNPIWIRNDKTFLQKDDGNGWMQGSKIFTEVGTKNIEVGKLYVVTGENAGKYYLYIKADDTLILDYYSSNDFNNNSLFFTGTDGNKAYSIDFDGCDTHTLGELVPAIPATCDTDGTVAYYSCSSCGKYFSDAEGKNELTSLVIPKHHTPGEQVGAVASTCCTHGTIAYYECTACGNKFSDQACATQLTSLEAPYSQHTIENDECTVCHTKFNFEFISATDGTKITFENQIEFWKYSTAIIEFYSTYSSLLIDLVSPSVDSRVSEKKTLNGTEVLGLTSACYYYSFEIKDLATNGTTGCETLDGMRFRCSADYANFKVTVDENIFETADEISVKDLQYLDGKACGKVITFNVSGGRKFQWNATAEHKSVIFSFMYTVDEIPSMGDYSYGQFHFKNSWSDTPLWPRNDKTFIKKDGDAGYVEGLKIFTEPGTKIITFGKVYITSGDLAGKYYLFVKADGVTVAEYVSGYDFNNNYMFCTLDDGSKWRDLTSGPDVYEEADEITVRDLYYNGNQMTNIMVFDEVKEYTYNATKEHKSVIFKFKYEVNEMPTSDYSYTQIYFSKLWISSTIWIRNDSTFIKKDEESGWISCNKIFTETGTKEIEVGKLYVLSGDNEGLYYLYIKADGILIGEYYSSNDYNNNILSFTGNDRKNAYSFDYVPCNGTHTLGEQVVAVSATCDADGSVAYYYCSNCGKYFSDDEGTKELTTIVVPKHHTITKVDYLAPTCDVDGNIEHYHCSVCGKDFGDELCTFDVSTVVVISAHHNLSIVGYMKPTCTVDGNIEHYHCLVCKKNFSDDAGKVEVFDVVISAHHNLTKVNGKEAKCNAPGNVEYYHCSVCSKNYKDSNGYEEILDVNIYSSDDHNLVKVEAKDATCDSEGNVEYYYCKDCNEKFSDQNGKYRITSAVTPKTHKLTKVEGIDATCTEDGTIEHYICSECGKIFKDADGKTEITDINVSAKGHNFVNGYCTECNAMDPSSNPLNTILQSFGCTSSISIGSLISLAAIALFFFKKKKRY